MTTSDYRKLTQEELVAELRAAFGDDSAEWAFRCPNCGDVARARDFPSGSAQLGQACVGRFVKEPRRGCDWAAFGLIRGPWEIVMPDGHSAWSFAIAEPRDQGADERATSGTTS